MSSKPEPATLPAANRSRPWLRALDLALTLAALAHPLMIRLARLSWRADMLTHLQELGFLATVARLIVSASLQRREALAWLALALVQVGPLLRYEGPNPVPPDPAHSQRLKVLMANVLHTNERFELLADLIRREQPDIIGLVEVTDRWLVDLAGVRRAYPYRFEASIPDGAVGLTLWSKRPILDSEYIGWLVPGSWPAIRITIEFAGTRRQVWLMHPSNPVRRGMDVSVADERAALAERIRRLGGSALVIGDFNCTDGSPSFFDFLTVTGLRDSRLGFGRQPSWPNWSPYRIAIDHAFVTPDLAVADRRLGPPIGSDHFPLIVELAPAASDPKAASRSASQDGPSNP